MLALDMNTVTKQQEIVNIELSERPGVGSRERRAGEVAGVGISPLPAFPIFPDGQIQNSIGVAGVRPPGTEDCGQYATLTECEAERHAFRKMVICGREWCPECGKDDSPAHDRRKARFIERAQTMATMGYYVVEFPLASRPALLTGSPEDIRLRLRAIRQRVVNAMRGKRQRDGLYNGRYTRMMARWHWIGDVCEKSKDNKCQLSGNKCPKSRCGEFVNNGAFNPHLNLLVDDTHLEPGTLAEMKRILKKALKEPNLIVHYDYKAEPVKMVHLVSYVTRPTLKEYNWQPKLANSLYNVRTSFSYGNWNTEKLWGLDDTRKDIRNIIALQSGLCPICGSPLKVCRHTASGKPCYWTKPIGVELLAAYPVHDLGGGFAQLDVPQLPGDAGIPFVEMIRLQVKLVKHRELYEKQRQRQAEAERNARTNTQGRFMHDNTWTPDWLEDAHDGAYQGIPEPYGGISDTLPRPKCFDYARPFGGR